MCNSIETSVSIVLCKLALRTRLQHVQQPCSIAWQTCSYHSKSVGHWHRYTLAWACTFAAKRLIAFASWDKVPGRCIQSHSKPSPDYKEQTDHGCWLLICFSCLLVIIHLPFHCPFHCWSIPQHPGTHASIHVSTDALVPVLTSVASQVQSWRRRLQPAVRYVQAGGPCAWSAEDNTFFTGWLSQKRLERRRVTTTTTLCTQNSLMSALIPC